MILDWTTGKLGYRLSANRWRHEPLIQLVKATQALKPSVFDLTAGIGFDASLLAQAGCTVTAFEKNSIVSGVFKAAFEKAALSPLLTEACQRLTLIAEDATLYLATHPELKADFVYCDPMFPQKTKTAKAHQWMQWLQSVETPPTLEEEQALLHTAQKTARQWVIVKRPRIAPFLGLQKPHHQSIYKSCRFDVYTPIL